jgi:hypothetical protein
MDLGVFGHGYQLIGGLVAIGVILLLTALALNRRLAASVRSEERHAEKRLEYQRNIVSQLGMLLTGIGVSLFIFYYQQDFQERRRWHDETEVVLAKLASRLGRAAADLEFLPQYDVILDEGGPYIGPEHGGTNGAVTAAGPDLARQVEALRLAERDVTLDIFSDLEFSADLRHSPLMPEIDPAVWFAMHRNENDLRYAVSQLAADYRDLADAIGGTDPAEAVLDPVAADAIKREALDVLYDLDLLRDRSRRIVARACWFLAHDRDFVRLHPIEEIGQPYATHGEWIEQARRFIAPFSIGGENCFDMLRYTSPTDLAAQ